MFHSRVLYEGDTAYGHYQVADVYYNGRPARVLYSGNNDAAQSGMAKDDKPGLLFDYNRRFVELVRGIRPDSLLLIGGGALTLPTALRHEFPGLSLDIVELDGDLVDIAREYFDFKPDGHTRVHIGDGRQFLNTTPHKYDTILVDVFTHAAIPPAFQTLEFVRSLKQHLTKHGVTAMNVISSLEGRRSAVLQRMHEAVQATFMDARIFPASRGESPWTPQNFILTAQDGGHDLISYLGEPPVTLEI